MQRSVLFAALAVVACGNVQHDDLDSAESGGTGASAAADGGTSSIMVGGSSGSANTFSPSGDCDFGELTCPDGEYFVDITDGNERVRLGFPASTGCGDCSSNGCVLFGDGMSGCHMLTLTFAACASQGGFPPCLELAGSVGQYADAEGRVFDVTSIEELVSDSGAEQGVIQISLALTLADPADPTRTLGAELRLCGSVYQTLVPC